MKKKVNKGKKRIFKKVCNCSLMCSKCFATRRHKRSGGLVIDAKCHSCKDTEFNMIDLGTKIRTPSIGKKNRWKEFLEWLYEQPIYKHWEAEYKITKTTNSK